MNQLEFSAAAPARTTMNGKPVFSVPAKSVINFESGFRHKLLCDGPTFTTGSACAYSCTFCYVEDLMRKNPHWQEVQKKSAGAEFENVVIRRAGAVTAMRDQLTDRHGKSKFTDPQDQRVIYASPLVDVAANMDLVRETIEACFAILELTNWHIRLLSKSNLLPKVAEGLEKVRTDAKARVIYGVSTGTRDNSLAQSFEVGTPTVSKRIASLHWLQDNGFRTFGMICPSLPQTNYRKFAREMAAAIRADRCEHVWGEVINLRGDSFDRTISALRAGGHNIEADRLTAVCTDVAPELRDQAKRAWERYARGTFAAHAAVYSGKTGPDGKPKLRFLQYVTAETRAWWKAHEASGAVLL